MPWSNGFIHAFLGRYCIADRRVLPTLSALQQEQLLTQAGTQSLASIFEAVPDPRKAHGLRSDLPFLLTCWVAALLCHCDSSEAVAQWCRDQHPLLREVFDPCPFLTPSGSPYRWLLPCLDAVALERVLGTWVQATTSAPADEPLALDGKTVRGARGGEQVAQLTRTVTQAQATCTEIVSPLLTPVRAVCWNSTGATGVSKISSITSGMSPLAKITRVCGPVRLLRSWLRFAI